jgi:hypothetical protein
MLTKEKVSIELSGKTITRDDLKKILGSLLKNHYNEAKDIFRRLLNTLFC